MTSDKQVAFVTNACEYGGPGTITALSAQGWQVYCHDDSFSSEDARRSFECQNANCTASLFQDTAAFGREGLQRFGRVDAVVCNDVPKNLSIPIGMKDSKSVSQRQDRLQDFEEFTESLLLASVRLLRAVLPCMKERGDGSILFVTSGAPLINPLVSSAHGYSAMRAAVHTLVRALATELGPNNIQVNAIAPYLIYSQTFFPSDIGPEDPKFEAMLREKVPMRRFGTAEEFGELVTVLVGGKARFVSGQVISFSGGGS